MALTDITTYEGSAVTCEYARGNTGTPTDIQSGRRTSAELEAAGGNIFIMSE